MTPTKNSYRAALRLALLLVPAWALGGAAGPEISLDRTDVDYGTVPVVQGPGVEVPVAIWNNGSLDLSLSEIMLEGNDPGDFQIVNAPSLTPVGPGQYRLVKVIYAPRTVGSHNAKLKITSSDSDEPEVEVDLEGTSTNAAPVPQDDDYTTPEDTPLYVNAPGLLGNDSDPDGVQRGLLLHFVSKPVDAILGHAPKGDIYYIPAPDFNGLETQVYTVHDGFDVSAPATIRIDVTSVIDPPLMRFARSLVTGPTNLRAVAVAVDTPPMPDEPEAVDISESPNFDFFQSVPYTGQGEATYTLTQAGDGDRQLYVRLRNEGGTSPAQTVTVTLDETAPAVDPTMPLQVTSSNSLDPTNVDFLVGVKFTEAVYTIAGSIPGVANSAIELGGTVNTSGLTAGIAYPVRKSGSPDVTYVHVTGSVPTGGVLTVGFKASSLRDAAGNLLLPPAPASIALSSSVSDWQLLN